MSDETVELAFYYPVSNLLATADKAKDGEYILAVMDRNRTVTRKVVVKEDDLLTPEEVKQLVRSAKVHAQGAQYVG